MPNRFDSPAVPHHAKHLRSIAGSGVPLNRLKFVRAAILWLDESNKKGCPGTGQRMSDLADLLTQQWASGASGVQSAASQTVSMILLTKLLEIYNMPGMQNVGCFLDQMLIALSDFFETWQCPEIIDLGPAFQQEDVKKFVLKWTGHISASVEINQKWVQHPRVQLVTSCIHLSVALGVMGKVGKEFLPGALKGFVRCVVREPEHLYDFASICQRFGLAQWYLQKQTVQPMLEEVQVSLQKIAYLSRLVLERSPKRISIDSSVGQQILNHSDWKTKAEIPELWEDRLKYLLGFRCVRDASWLLEDELVLKLCQEQVLVRHPGKVSWVFSSDWYNASLDEVSAFFEWVSQHVHDTRLSQHFKTILTKMCEDARKTWGFLSWKPHKVSVELMSKVLPGQEGFSMADAISLVQEMAVHEDRGSLRYQ